MRVIPLALATMVSLSTAGAGQDTPDIRGWRTAVTVGFTDMGSDYAVGPGFALGVAFNLVPQTSIIGLGLGPQGAGILSDLLEPRFGIQSLRYALLIIVVIFSCWSVFHFVKASSSIVEDLQAKQHLAD